MAEQCGGGTGGEHGRDAWREVGEQFEELGRTLARALKASWESEETRRRLRSVQAGLQSMAEEVGGTIRDAVPKAQAGEVRQQAERAVDATLVASHQAVEDVRPHLLAALRTVNGELQTLIERLERVVPGAEAAVTIPVRGPEAGLADAVVTAEPASEAGVAPTLAVPGGEAPPPVPEAAEVPEQAPEAPVETPAPACEPRVVLARPAVEEATPPDTASVAAGEPASPAAAEPQPEPAARRRHWWQFGRRE